MVGPKANRTKIFGLFCKAKFCFNLRDKKKKVHRFPSNPTVRKSWLDYCENGESLNPNDFLCSRHFKNSDYRRTKNSGMMLKMDAVPSVPLLDAAVTSKQTGEQTGEEEGDEKLLEMYDPQFDQQSLLDQIDGESRPEEFHTPNESEISSEYSVRIKEEQELIVDEDEDLYYENEYDDAYMAESGHEYYEQIEEQYDEVVAEAPSADESEMLSEKTEVVDEQKIDQDDEELLKDQEVDPTIDPAVEEPKEKDDIEVDPAPNTKSPPPIKKSSKGRPKVKSPTKLPVANGTDTVSSHKITSAVADKQPAEVSKEPDTPVTNGHAHRAPATYIEQEVHDMVEDFPIPEEEGPRRVTRSSDISKVPEKLVNGSGTAEKGTTTRKPEPPKSPENEQEPENNTTEIQDQTETEPTAPLHNSTPLPKAPKDKNVETVPPNKRKKRSLYVNPLSLANKQPQPPTLPEVASGTQAKRPRVETQPNKPTSAPASRSLPLTVCRPIQSHVRPTQPSRPPQPQRLPPPFRIRDPVLLETELTSLQSHYTRLKDENSRLHQENARMFLVNSRLQSENGRLRASAILTNSKLKLENEKLRAAAELTKAERIREQTEAQLNIEETEALKHELDEMRLMCDDLREQLTSAMTAANYEASRMPPPSETGDNESTTGSLTKKKKVTLSDETLVAADKLLNIVGKDLYSKINKLVAFPYVTTIYSHRKKNPALFENGQEVEDRE